MLEHALCTEVLIADLTVTTPSNVCDKHHLQHAGHYVWEKNSAVKDTSRLHGKKAEI